MVKGKIAGTGGVRTLIIKPVDNHIRDSAI
jgi:hypothetical protein